MAVRSVPLRSLKYSSKFFRSIGGSNLQHNLRRANRCSCIESCIDRYAPGEHYLITHAVEFTDPLLSIKYRAKVCTRWLRASVSSSRRLMIGLPIDKVVHSGLGFIYLLSLLNQTQYPSLPLTTPYAGPFLPNILRKSLTSSTGFSWAAK